MSGRYREATFLFELLAFPGLPALPVFLGLLALPIFLELPDLPALMTFLFLAPFWALSALADLLDFLSLVDFLACLTTFAVPLAFFLLIVVHLDRPVLLDDLNLPERLPLALTSFEREETSLVFEVPWER